MTDNPPPAENHDQRVSTETDPDTGRMLIFAVGGLAVLLLAGFAVAFGIRLHHDHQVKDETDTTADAVPIVEVVEVKPTAKNYPLMLPGHTAGWYESTLYSRVDGYVINWTPDIGARVKQGDVLATIHVPELEQQVAAAKAKAAASDAQIKVAESNVSIAKLTYDRWKNALQGEVSDQEREQKKADYDAANARLVATQAQARLDQADVSKYTALEGFSQLRAPYDGIITDRDCDFGDLVTAGSSANTKPLYSMAQYDKTIRVFVNVPQKAAADMVPGLKAHVTSDEYPGRVFEGEVARSAMSFDRQTRTEKTEVDIPNADLALKPEMAVDVTFELNQHGLLEVPAAAILYKPGGLQVAVIDANGKVDFRPITVAKDNGDTVELATGVQRGDRVALNISTAITPGETVKTEWSDSEPVPPAQPVPTPTPTPSPTVETTGPRHGVTPGNRPPLPDSGVHPPTGSHEPASPPQNTTPVDKPGSGMDDH
jgi:RND family efflux transporter MFP subunit